MVDEIGVIYLCSNLDTNILHTESHQKSIVKSGYVLYVGNRDLCYAMTCIVNTLHNRQACNAEEINLCIFGVF